MTCNVCNQEKLSKEFAPFNAADECDHAALSCLRCMVDAVANYGKCPYPGCSQQIDKRSDKIKIFEKMLAKMFKEYETSYSPVVESKDLDSDGSTTYINITGLTGESMQIPYTLKLTVMDLKNHIQRELRIETSKQKLLYEDKEIENNSTTGRMATLGDYNVKPNTTICLVVCLYSIPEDFNHVVFDLYWGYPRSGKDYLDASCLMFSGTTFYRACDYHYVKPHSSVRHSGDRMDDFRKQGHHTIDVFLQNIPADITHLFFTLSAWSCPNISKYRKPSLNFFEASKPNKSLCETSFRHANNSQAVVMCSVSRKDGNWKIFQSGKLSSGNAHKYGPLKETIRRLILSGF
ncbi:uncharacterized protein LOC127707904 isoform X2 [Mytilus californianus]|nr:uncharacterized protein LOC127707904 isoform X2 [Mytilus californianus]XP_052068625.1 uncharacterized protein LOC127707904 isoform X2 [Mytilus californianus]XP_052068626.1 uncharacterized protein LOC127707904 isoform X2 [Mytilus californianus]